MGQAKDSKSSEKVRAKSGEGQGLQELREGKEPRVGQAKDSKSSEKVRGQEWGRPRTPRAQRR